jgi:glycosyltransferase involved in cell wall biosynthesis
MPEVSILMPAYHSLGFIRESVMSLVGQSFADWELLIISDDGLNYEPIAQLDKRIRICSTMKNASGPGVARNIGLSKSCGKFICTLDSDDFFAPTRVEQMLVVARQHGLVTTAIACVNPAGELLTEVGVEVGGAAVVGLTNIRQYFAWNTSTHSIFMFDKAQIGSLCWPEMKSYEDTVFAAQLLDRFGKAYHINEPLFLYQKRQSSLFGAGKSDDFIRNKAALITAIQACGFDFNNPDSASALTEYLRLSIQAEHDFAAQNVLGSNLTFEEVFARANK